jgi:hypothetical protein
MTAHDELPTARQTAMLAVLRDIEQRAARGGPMAPQAVLSLAEAFAWIERPDQPHGSRTLPRAGGTPVTSPPQA